MNNKKTFLLGLLVIAFTLHTSAQSESLISKNRISVGGSGSWGSSKKEGNDNSSYDTYNVEFAPKVSYFIANNLSIGFAPIISRNQESKKFNQIDDELLLHYDILSTTNTLGIEPFVRYYLNNGIFFGCSYLWGNVNNNYRNYVSGVRNDETIIDNKTEKESTYKSNAFRMEAGYAYFINSTISLEISLNYTIEKDIDDIDLESVDFQNTPDNTHNLIDYKTTRVQLSLGFGILL